MTGKVKFISIVLVILVAIIVGAMTRPSSEKQNAATARRSLPPDYWQQPLKPQGTAPGPWSKLEKSLNPKDCGACHADKYSEWKTSLHARAFSPGLVGQLLTYDRQNADSCMKCHAPLAEQKQAFAAARARGQGAIPLAQGLAAVGNSCGGCHIRKYKHFGPPQRDTGLTGQSDPTNPHGGAFRTPDFEKSQFCAVCHQFPQSYAINGKPLENTVAEWQASPQATKGISCQSCHMPGRRHLWRGIHNPKMVKSGLEANFKTNNKQARFIVKNTGVGHAFPTYITPKVVMHAVALDDQGRELPATAVSYVIRRSVGYNGDRWVEYSDTRLLPDQSASLILKWQTSQRIRMWLDIYPDDYYQHQVYGDLLSNDRMGSPERKLIKKAIARARRSNFILFDTILKKPE